MLEVGDDLCGLEVLDVEPKGCITIGFAPHEVLIAPTPGESRGGRGMGGRGRGRGRGTSDCPEVAPAVRQEVLESCDVDTAKVEDADIREPEMPNYDRRTLLRVRELMLAATECVGGSKSTKSTGSSLPRLKAPTQAQMDKQLLLAVRAGELPPRSWRSCSSPCKSEGLLEALRAGHMHIVYAMQPASDVFREGVQSSALDDEFLRMALGMLCEDALAAGRLHPAPEPTAWLLERGAPVTALLHKNRLFGGLQILSKMPPAISSRPDILTEILLRTRDRDQRVRCAAVEAIGCINALAPTASMCDLLATLLRDADSSLQQMASNGLGAAGEDGVRAAAGLLQDSDAKVRRSATQAIQIALQSGSSAARALAAAAPAETFVQWLYHEDHALRLLAAHALGAIGEGAGAVAAEALACIAQSDPQDDMREAAVAAIGTLGSDSAAFVEVVAGLLDDSSPFVQEAAGSALDKMMKSSGDR
mmetsp:Transcript_57494/g.134788  ORF Transcript_57494/g.134788 Transcript_57494/m.134788 type:complete len:476 (-) Transcript_57494:40-1467(-)